jgi:hypothetical protein
LERGCADRAASLDSAWQAISDVAYALLTATDRLSQELPLVADIHEEILLGLSATDGARVIAALHRHYQAGEVLLAGAPRSRYKGDLLIVH